MPAYANAEGKVVFCFTNSGKCNDRYSTIEFQDAVRLDDGENRPVSFALQTCRATLEKKAAEPAQRHLIVIAGLQDCHVVIELDAFNEAKKIASGLACCYRHNFPLVAQDTVPLWYHCERLKYTVAARDFPEYLSLRW